MQTNFCDFCNLVVAPQEPNRIKVGKKVFHSSCFKKHLGNRPIVIEGREEVPNDMADEDFVLQPRLPFGASTN